MPFIQEVTHVAFMLTGHPTSTTFASDLSKYHYPLCLLITVPTDHTSLKLVLLRKFHIATILGIKIVVEQLGVPRAERSWIR